VSVVIVLDESGSMGRGVMHTEYLLAYSPQHVMRDGKFHRVSLRLARRSNRFPRPGDSATTTH
jgi:hypothetical protein